MKDLRAWRRAMDALVYLAKRNGTHPFIATAPAPAGWPGEHVGATVRLGQRTLMFRTAGDRDTFIEATPGAVKLERLPFIEEMDL